MTRFGTASRVEGCRRYHPSHQHLLLGHLCHMLGIKNRHAKMYEDEMNKYRVDDPDLEDLDDEDVFDAIMNRAMEGVDLLAEKEAGEENGGDA